MVLACLTCSALAAASLASSARAQAMLSLIDSWKLFGKYSCVGVPFQPFRRAIGCSLSLSAVGLEPAGLSYGRNCNRLAVQFNLERCLQRSLRI